MVQLVNPATRQPLVRDGETLVDKSGARFPMINGIPRFCPASNYTDNFGKQWNLFQTTQIDRADEEIRVSETRFFRTTGWSPEDLAGLDILEVGSGAGRFSRSILERTGANLWSVDYSSAVEANLRNNGHIAPDRFHLFQASIYEMPFPDDSFDKVFCMGVLQHTPDFEQSVRALVQKAKRGGEIVVDFYPIKGFWTKLHAKYLLRPVTRRMSHDRLLGLVRANADWLIGLSAAMRKVGLGPLTRFLPLVDLDTLPPLSPEKRREWVILDTFDMFSPEHDHPQRIARVAEMFERHGADVRLAEFIPTGIGSGAVVRAIKR